MARCCESEGNEYSPSLPAIEVGCMKGCNEVQYRLLHCRISSPTMDVGWIHNNQLQLLLLYLYILIKITPAEIPTYIIRPNKMPSTSTSISLLEVLSNCTLVDTRTYPFRLSVHTVS
jgi:hypothetical protein